MNLITKLCAKTSYAISFILPYSKFSKIVTKIGIIVYTNWIKREFKSFGENSIIIPKFSMLMGQEYISIGNFVTIGKGTQLTAWKKFREQTFNPEIILGDNCSIGEDSHITAINSIRLGNNVRLGKKILITDNAHGASSAELLDIAPNYRPLFSKGAVIIDDNVWIGEKASIMPGVHVGKGVIIAANSVVTHDIPAYSVVAGTPAKIVKYLK